MPKFLMQFHVTATADTEEEALVLAQEFLATSAITGYSALEYDSFEDIEEYLADDAEGNPILNDADNYITF